MNSILGSIFENVFQRDANDYHCFAKSQSEPRIIGVIYKEFYFNW